MDAVVFEVIGPRPHVWGYRSAYGRQEEKYGLDTKEVVSFVVYEVPHLNLLCGVRRLLLHSCCRLLQAKWAINLVGLVPEQMQRRHSW